MRRQDTRQNNRPPPAHTLAPPLRIMIRSIASKLRPRGIFDKSTTGMVEDGTGLLACGLSARGLRNIHFTRYGFLLLLIIGFRFCRELLRTRPWPPSPPALSQCRPGSLAIPRNPPTCIRWDRLHLGPACTNHRQHHSAAEASHAWRCFATLASDAT